jgi:hypothetical protein
MNAGKEAAEGFSGLFQVKIPAVMILLLFRKELCG